MIKKYKLVATGNLHIQDKEQVIKNLIAVGMRADQAPIIVAAKGTIKKGLAHTTAIEWIEKLNSAGMHVQLEAYMEDFSEEDKREKQTIDVAFDTLSKAFDQPIAPTKTTRQYTTSFVWVLIIALIAPLAYWSVVGSMGWALWWYITEGRHAFFGDFHLGGKVGTAILLFSYVGPTACFVLTIIFLLAPLWPAGRKPKPFVLERKKNERLYKIIEKMASNMGVPSPQYIELIVDVNAAAGSQEGLIKLSQGKLKLVIGMSLVVGMSTQELFGVLAHEFGHFSQRSSMMAYYWINTINRWLAQCALYRSSLEEWVFNLQNQGDNSVLWATALLTRTMMKGVKIFFKALLEINIKLTHALSRQMEFDADLYEAKVIGSKNFKSATLTLRKLCFAWNAVNQQNKQGLDQGKIFKNIPEAVLKFYEELPSNINDIIESDMREESTQLWDTHPADKERIQNAENALEPGILACNIPAHKLFFNFNELSEHVTMYYYYKLGIGGAKDFAVCFDDMVQSSSNNPTPSDKDTNEKPVLKNEHKKAESGELKSGSIDQACNAEEFKPIEFKP